MLKTYLSRLKSIANNIVELTDDTARVPLRLTMEDVEGWTGNYRSGGSKNPLKGTVKKFRADDVLFGRLRPYLAKTVCPNAHGVCVTEFLVLRPDPSVVLPRFLAYWLRTKPVVDQISSSTFGAKMPRADWSAVGAMTIRIPSVSEQHTVVQWLDSVTQDLDMAVASVRREVELLREYRATLISDVVTGRLNFRDAMELLPEPNGEGE